MNRWQWWLIEIVRAIMHFWRCLLSSKTLERWWAWLPRSCCCSTTYHLILWTIVANYSFLGELIVKVKQWKRVSCSIERFILLLFPWLLAGVVGYYLWENWGLTSLSSHICRRCSRTMKRLPRAVALDKELLDLHFLFCHMLSLCLLKCFFFHLFVLNWWTPSSDQDVDVFFLWS